MSIKIDPSKPDDQKKAWIWILSIVAVVIFCYWNSLLRTGYAWFDATYQFGFLVPVFAAFLIWHWRKPLVEATPQEVWVALGIIVVATLMRVAASHYVQFSIDRLTFLICLAGVFIFVGGFRALEWSGPGIAFMVFMFPWPRYFTDHIMRPMQTLATMISTYALQTLGIDAYQDGNRILLEHVPMNVAEQCSGLRMLTIFIALSVAMALISTHRPIWERFIIALSSVPIALLVNSIRISLTGVLLSLEAEAEILDRVFHDFAGLVMMPMAIGLLFLEMYILARIVIEDQPKVSIGLQ